jgi:hypothetical protein
MFDVYYYAMPSGTLSRIETRHYDSLDDLLTAIVNENPGSEVTDRNKGVVYLSDATIIWVRSI